MFMDSLSLLFCVFMSLSAIAIILLYVHLSIVRTRLGQPSLISQKIFTYFLLFINFVYSFISQILESRGTESTCNNDAEREEKEKDKDKAEEEKDKEIAEDDEENGEIDEFQLIDSCGLCLD